MVLPDIFFNTVWIHSFVKKWLHHYSAGVHAQVLKPSPRAVFSTQQVLPCSKYHQVSLEHRNQQPNLPGKQMPNLILHRMRRYLQGSVTTLCCAPKAPVLLLFAEHTQLNLFAPG